MYSRMLTRLSRGYANLVDNRSDVFPADAAEPALWGRAGGGSGHSARDAPATAAGPGAYTPAPWGSSSYEDCGSRRGTP